jgi:hypothetical protein
MKIVGPSMPQIDKFQMRLAERWLAMSGKGAAYHAATKAGEAAAQGQEQRRLWWLGVLSHIETLHCFESTDS